VVRALAAAALALLPRAALACPYCAANDTGNPVATGLMLGGFILLPFAITFVAARVIRRGGLDHDDAHTQPQK
jgi:hypothetical protein